MKVNKETNVARSKNQSPLLVKTLEWTSNNHTEPKNTDGKDLLGNKHYVRQEFKGHNFDKGSYNLQPLYYLMAGSSSVGRCGCLSSERGGPVTPS